MAWAGGAASDAAAVSTAVAIASFIDFIVVPSSIPTRWLPIKPVDRWFWRVSVDYGRFLAFGDRPGQLLLVANSLQLFQRLVEARTQPLAGGERRRQVLHSLDDADGLGVLGALGVAYIVGHPVEHGGEHRLEDGAGDVGADAAMHADAEAEVPVAFSVEDDLVW